MNKRLLTKEERQKHCRYDLVTVDEVDIDGLLEAQDHKTAKAIFERLEKAGIVCPESEWENCPECRLSFAPIKAGVLGEGKCYSGGP